MIARVRRIGVRTFVVLTLAGAWPTDAARAQGIVAVVSGVVPTPPRATTTSLPFSTLSVRTAHGWRTWWTSVRAPLHWATADTTLTSALAFRPVSDGVELGELSLAGSREAWRTRLVVVRVDPQRVRLALDTAMASARAQWTIERAPGEARFAVNAGQFLSSMPWGLVVLDGRRLLPAGTGPLVSTIAIDSSGAVRWQHEGGTGEATGRARWAFQSYPTLIRGGNIPELLRARSALIDVGHRDARLALGSLPDGRLLVAMTRFDLLGPRLGFIPFGLTVPEMSAVMGALGAREAVLLDGGISAQMLVRSEEGGAREWRGMRAVPLALVALPR